MPTDPNAILDYGKIALTDIPGLSDPEKESLWDTFHNVSSANELAQRLQNSNVSDPVKKDLLWYREKQDRLPAAAPHPAIGALTNLHQLSQMKVADLAEKYPNVASALIDAAMDRASGPSISTDQSDIPPITAAGAIENQPQFRRAAKAAWDATQRASLIAETDPSRAQIGHTEAGFTVDRNGNPSAVATNDEPKPGSGGSLEQNIDPNTLIAVHSHPLFMGTSQPSKNDVQIAERTGHPIAVISKDGLFEADAQGNVREVEKGTGWMNEK